MVNLGDPNHESTKKLGIRLFFHTERSARRLVGRWGGSARLSPHLHLRQLRDRFRDWRICLIKHKVLQHRQVSLRVRCQGMWVLDARDADPEEPIVASLIACSVYMY